MKFFVFFFLFTLALVTFVVSGLLVSPYYFYSRVLNGKSYAGWYEQPSFDEKWLEPVEYPALTSAGDVNANLWQHFHMGDVVIPLPVRNPFYEVQPILNARASVDGLFGLSFYSADKREISKVFFIKNIQFFNQINSQGLFKLPLIRKEILNYEQDDLWNKIFTKKLDSWNISFSEMIENLYILQLRKALLPSNFKRFGLMKGSEYALLDVESENLDFDSEYVFTRNQGIIYSMVLYTRKGNIEAEKVRYKLLSDFRFRPTSRSLAHIIHKEFTSLPYQVRTDQAGMLYLLSAWSHDPARNYIREMIEFLERGEGNELQLSPLYDYAYEKYGMTYTRRDSKSGRGEVHLRRKIEIERRREEERIRRSLENKKVEEPRLTREEELEKTLRDAKKTKRKRTGQEVLID